MMTIIAAMTSSTSLVNVMCGHFKPVLRGIGVKFPYRADSVTKMRLGGAAVGGSARAGDFRICANQLLEAHVERVDAGTAEAAVGGDQAVETLGVINRPNNRGRQAT